MENTIINFCKCSICQGADTNPTKVLHRAMNLFVAQLDDRQKAIYIGLEAKKRGAGSERSLSLIFGWDEQAIAAARKELERLTGDLDSTGGPGRQPSLDNEGMGFSVDQIQYNNAKIAMAVSYLEKAQRAKPKSAQYKA